MLNVLVVDDSDTARQALRAIISTARDMRIVSEARSGQQAVDLTRKLRPNVVLMDITMPGMNGMEATREIMRTQPTPIVMVSAGLDGREAETLFEALQLGALTVLPKPVGPRDPHYASQCSRLLNTVRSMAEVRVIHHWREPKAADTGRNTEQLIPAARTSSLSTPKIVGIVASTGGPAALSHIIRHLPPDFDLPVVIVQHLAPDFVPSLAQWLNTLTPLHVMIAEEGERPAPGHIYLAPGGANLVLTKQHRFALDTRMITPFTPSGDVLLESIAASYGAYGVGIVLTGMGSDGAYGLRAMRDADALTIAQDEATSIVFGMPQQAIALDAAQHVLALADIPTMLAKTTTVKELLQ
jgi:two-component system chemotaxis response regulator CheB